MKKRMIIFWGQIFIIVIGFVGSLFLNFSIKAYDMNKPRKLGNGAIVTGGGMLVDENVPVSFVAQHAGRATVGNVLLGLAFLGQVGLVVFNKKQI